MHFIDWLSMYQDHDEEVPVLGGDYVISVDSATGELIKQTLKGYQHMGSFDTSLRIRSEGNRVSISGNPSSFCRTNNLFGCFTIADAIKVYNKLLEELGLPTFYEKPVSTLMQLQYKGGEGLPWVFGARITEVHVTENLETKNSGFYLRYLSTFIHWANGGNLYPNGKTVDWNKGSKRVYIIYYEKEHDLKRKLEKSDEKLRKAKTYEEEYQRMIHCYKLQEIIDYCKEKQVVRHETKLKTRQLDREGLQRIGAWDGETMNNVIRPYQFHNRLQLKPDALDDTYEKLVQNGVIPKRAKKLQSIVKAWLQGERFSTHGGWLSRSEFYRCRKDLLGIGFDISSVCDISRLPLKTMECKAIPIDDIPDFYDLDLAM